MPSLTALDPAARPGAVPAPGGGTAFRVWAPFVDKIAVSYAGGRRFPLDKGDDGYFTGLDPETRAGDRYSFILDGEKKRPDPASRLQADTVHGDSVVVADDFPWTDGGWRGLALEDHVFYELHVGTFREGGTFDAAADALPALKDLGVTAVELMPVAQFPGGRNWGYDGVLPYAVQNTYGGPDGLRRFVDRAHGLGLAVILDVVYNHLGPEGNYLSDFGPYFTDAYRTPWGKALNFDDGDSGPVRQFFVENALSWIRDYHIDGLRLDAVHAIRDFSAVPFLADLAAAVHAEGGRLGRPVYLFPESDLNDSRILRPRPQGGWGHDAQWSDDFHHAVHAFVTGERNGYYADFGRLEDIATAVQENFVYADRYSAFRRRRHGNRADDLPPRRFITFIQNHDQVGNRAEGDRLTAAGPRPEILAALALNILSPGLPLLFMGEEYAESNPFPYFISHGDPKLVEAVRRGRRGEFRGFGWKGQIPDPASEDTFNSAVLRPDREREPERARWKSMVRDLIRFRLGEPRIRLAEPGTVRAAAFSGDGLLVVRYGSGEKTLSVWFNLSGAESGIPENGSAGKRVVWDPFGAVRPGGERTLSPWSFAVFEGE